MTKTISDAFELMVSAHANQLDKQNKPYFYHPAAVALSWRLTTDEEKQAALLHDVIEDTWITEHDLIRLGFGYPVTDIVLLVSRIPDETYTDFIIRIKTSENQAAINVKMADIEHNLSRPLPNFHSQKKRYDKALLYLDSIGN